MEKEELVMKCWKRREKQKKKKAREKKKIMTNKQPKPGYYSVE